MSGSIVAEQALSASRLAHRYGSVQAVRSLDLTVSAGELYGLVGPDGAGKSTTIACLAGLLRPSEGSVRVLGEDPLARRSRARERLGLMPQQYSLYGDLTVAENLRFFGRLFGLTRAQFATRSTRLLGITRLERFQERRADALSGGMYKKLALACALLHEPSVLLLDEPTNGVDPVSRRELWALIYEFVAEGMAVLVSTPYMDEAARCHRVGLLHEGRLIAEGAPQALVQRLEHEVYEVVGGERDAVDALLTDHPEVIAATPLGARLRIVVELGARALDAQLESVGAELRRVAPDFEDLFLARISGRGGAS